LEHLVLQVDVFSKRRLANRCLCLLLRGAIGHDLTADALKLGLVTSYHGAEAEKGNDAS
jgi:hypothetical protein